MTKVKIWVVATTIPEYGEPPCRPSLFTSLAEAEAHLDQEMRGEWSNNMTDGDLGGGGPDYPGDWRVAHDLILAASGPSWGTYELTVHDVQVPGTTDEPVKNNALLSAAPEMYEALDGLVNNGFSDEELATRWGWPVERITAARAAFAKAEGRT